MYDLDMVRKTAERILRQDPSPVVRYRLLRDVLGRAAEDPVVMKARNDLMRSRWVRALEDEQWPDGSWGRLHSKDYRVNQRIGTTEMGVARALALGLEADDTVLRRASRYLRGILEGWILCRDRAEKNDRWNSGVQLFAASSLAQIESDQTTLDEAWNLWLDILRRTFAGGFYDAEAEIRAHRELTGASIKDSYLVINNRYALALFAARPHLLARQSLLPDLETAFLKWLWHKENGIGYLGERLSSPPSSRKSGPLERWFMSLELLSRFPGWHNFAHETVRWLWNERTPDGFWDFGRRTSFSVALPLSEHWRKPGARGHDWSTRVLILSARYSSQDLQDMMIKGEV